MKISKEKRQRLALVLLVTAMGLVGLWFGVISLQQEKLRMLKVRRDAAAQKLQTMKRAIENADQIEAQLTQTRAKLSTLEETMASGDLYSWAINTIRTFKMNYKVEIPQFSQIDGPKDVNLLPDFPYKQATLTVAGTGFFHDIGKFISDFENQFPYMRCVNLSVEPISSLLNAEQEKLSFKMDIITLVRPGAV